MRTLATKMALDQKSFRGGNRGAKLSLVLWSVVIFAGSALLVSGSGDSFTLALVVCGVAMSLLAVADLFHEGAPDMAILLRLAGTLAMLGAGALFVWGVYQMAGVAWAVVVGGLSVVGISAGSYLQRGRNGRPGGG